MADGVVVRTNIQDFKKQLAEFGKDFERRVMRAATNAAAQVFKKRVIEKAPTRSGLLKRAIYVKRSRDSTRGREHYFVGVRQGRAARKRKKGSLDAYYWYFLERGWTPRGPGRALKGGRRTKALLRSRSRAAGVAELQRPFILPAFREVKTGALQAFTDRINKRIAAENNKRTPRSLA